MRILMLAAALAMAGGCTTRPGDTPPGSISYRLGYADGCDTGYASAGHPLYFARKDAKRFEQDPIYRQGWLDGDETCRREHEATTQD